METWPMGGSLSEGSRDGNGEVSEDVQNERKSVFLALVSQLSYGMDLTKITLPTFVLEPRSLLEKLTDICSHPQLLNSASLQPNPTERFLAVVKFYLSMWHVRGGAVKKPFNPILGETFRATRTCNDSEVVFIMEQVSHHPPISACFIGNNAYGWHINGSVWTKSQFLVTSAAAHLVGTASLTFLNLPGGPEHYEFTFPSAYIKGFIIGPLKMEYGGSTYLSCPALNRRAEFEFKRKAALWGGYHEVQARILDTSGRRARVTHTITGRWTEELHLTDCEANTRSLLIDVRREEQVSLSVDEQVMGDFESRRLWANVANALRANDITTATKEKQSLEDRQRAAKEGRQLAGVTWEPQFFEGSQGSYRYRYLRDKPYPPGAEAESKREPHHTRSPFDKHERVE